MITAVPLTQARLADTMSRPTTSQQPAFLTPRLRTIRACLFCLSRPLSDPTRASPPSTPSTVPWPTDY
eukprot:m.535142 g.535142  ORF g.535142 m.535142 type:complete len:68 (+) comp242617_c0_seq1:113-316(+)